MRYGIYSLLIELPISGYVLYWLTTHFEDFSSKPLSKKLRWGITIIVTLFSLFLVIFIVSASWPCYRTVVVGTPPDCSNIDLRGVDLSGVNLRGANFYSADLRDANFSGADLTGADFREADLERVNFSNANLCNAKFDYQAGPKDKRRFLGECTDQVPMPITSCDEVPNLMKNETVLCMDTRDPSGKGNLWTLSGDYFGVNTIDNYGIIQFESGRDLYLAFSPPEGKKLTIGLYENATSKPSKSDPGLNFYGYGWGCDGENGKFKIFEVAYDASGNIERFAANFERFCEGRSTRMTGYIQFNSSD
ncbi:MAG: pentapeptide repeat-containing protein [Anaerolineales bacterium]|nr:pentapeptide repeat-containing protein [Anaerolineales bacterium]